MSSKTVYINTHPPITDIEKCKKDTTKIINDIYHRFVTEANENHRQNCLQKLEDYCFVNNKNKMWDGRHVRYVDTTNAFDMPLKLGGFLIDDNGYTVTLKNDKRIFRVRKQGKHFFMMINNRDKIRSLLINGY